MVDGEEDDDTYSKDNNFLKLDSGMFANNQVDK